MNSYYGKLYLKELSSDNPNEIIADKKVVLKKDKYIIVYPGYTIIDNRYYYLCSEEENTDIIFLVNRDYIKIIKTKPDIFIGRITSFLDGYKAINNIYNDINQMIQDSENVEKYEYKSAYNRHTALLSQISEDDIESYHTFYKRLVDIRTSMREVLEDVKRIESEKIINELKNSKGKRRK